MAKFSGNIGFIITKETEPGSCVWESEEKTRHYCGDWNRINARFQSSGGVNDNVTITSELSIVADPYAIKNLGYIRYVEFMENKWKVESVLPQSPRLILSIGGLYNG